MSKTPETPYRNFVAHVEGRIPDTLPKDQATIATREEIGFWKHYQMSRAIRNRRAGKATIEEIRYIGNRGVYYHDTPGDIPRRHVPKKKTPSKNP